MADFITQYESESFYQDTADSAQDIKRARDCQVWLHMLVNHFREVVPGTDGGSPYALQYVEPESNPGKRLQRIEIVARQYRIDKFSTLFTKALLTPAHSTIQITSTALRNGVLFKARTKQQRLLMMRHFHRINSWLTICKFRVHHTSGSISLSLQLMFSAEGLAEEEQIDNLARGVKEGINTANRTFMFYYYKLGYMLGEYSLQEVRGLIRSSYLPVRQVRIDEECFGVMQKVLAYGNQHHEFMGHAVLEQVGLATPLPKGILVKQDNVVIPSKALEGDLSARLAHYNTPPLTERVDSNFSEKKLLELATALKSPSVKAANPAERNEILSSIHILNQDKVKWEKVGKGGFSLIELALQSSLVYIDKDSEELSEEQLKQMPHRHVHKPLVKKTDIEADSQKVEHQKCVLNTIAEKVCPYIVKFMESSQPGCEKTLFMDFCPLRGLNKYVENHQTTMGQVTSLYLLHQVAQALRFLSINNIQHLDVKPQNLLLTRNLVVKLTDFGESYHPKVDDQIKKDNPTASFRPGFTHPYSSPEIFLRTIPYSPALDIYSFGTVAHELLFGRVPIEVRRGSRDKLRQHYLGTTELHQLIVPELARSFGDQMTNQMLQCLLRQCHSRDPQARPLLQWLSIAMRLTFLLLDRLY